MLVEKLMLPELRAGPGVGDGFWASPGFWVESTNPQPGFSRSARQPGKGLCVWWQLPAKWLDVDTCCPGRGSVHPPRLCGVWGSGWSEQGHTQLAASHCHLGPGWACLWAPVAAVPADSSRQLRLCPLRGTPFQSPPGLCLPACELLCSSGPAVNICRLDAKRKFNHSQQLEGSLDSGHSIQMEEASPKALNSHLCSLEHSTRSKFSARASAHSPASSAAPRAQGMKMGLQEAGGPRQRCWLLLKPKDRWPWGQSLNLGER